MDKTKAHTYPDTELIAGALRNDRRYQELLYFKYADRMFTVAMQYMKDEDEAADVLQESFIKVFRGIEQLSDTRAFAGWLRRIVVNTALEHFKRKKRYFDIIEDASYEDDKSVSMELFKDLDSSEIVRFVNQLPEKAALVLKLYVLEGFAHHEIAEMMGISVGTSKSQLNRAKELLRQMVAVGYEQ